MLWYRNQKSHLFLILIFFIILITLSGCGISSTATTSIEAGGFLIDVPENFVEVNPVLVENKQIVDKVIKAWKIDKESWFDPTLLFTKSIIWPSLDYEQFYTVNLKKFEQYVPWYVRGSREIKKFNCGEQKISWLWVTFSVKSWFLDDESLYYFGQYQYVYEWSGYILSYASDNNTERDAMKDVLTSIRCKDK